MPKKLTTEEFIEKAKAVHGDKYDYSKTNLDNRDENGRVCIICSKHGEFWQTPKSHLNGYGCAKCAGCAKMTTQEFIEKAKIIHGDKYDYSKVNYVNTNTKVCIICPVHGEFMQSPNSHLRGAGCPFCSGNIKRSASIFIEKALKIHGDKFDYSKVNYVNTNTKVCIICPIHGEFWQTPKVHLNGVGCAKCAGLAKMTTQEFIEKARKVHGDKYDYSIVNYINSHTKVCIICPVHGKFWQSPNNHLNGAGCVKCGGKLIFTTQEFIEKAKIIHGNKYDYSKVNYMSNKTDVCIICHIHGEFWQNPNNHLRGAECPVCSRGFTKSYILSLLAEDDLDTMTSHQLIELIKMGVLPQQLKELSFSKAGSQKRKDTIQKLKEELSCDTSDEETENKINDDINEAEREYEQEQDAAADDDTISRAFEDEKPETVIKSLKIYDNFKFSVSEGEGEEFIVQEELHRLWNQTLDNESYFITLFRNEPSSGRFFDKIREMFMTQYEEVCALAVDNDCVFPYAPNLMQKLMVYYVQKNTFFGNWSAPGAGKSFSRDWSARMIDARVSVYVVPNGVIDTTVKSINEAYLDVNIIIPRELSDIKVLDRKQHNVIILNYEKFQQPYTGALICELLKNKIDFICLDEIQNVKVRNTDNISLRNRNMNAFIKNAREINPDLKLLAMSATPIINNLVEVRELMGLMTGTVYEEIGTKISMDNVHNAYKALLINGFRYVPKYDISINENAVEIDGSNIQDELLDCKDGKILDTEAILAKKKMEYCIVNGLVKKPTLVYSQYVGQGILNTIRTMLEKAGFKVGCHTGNEDSAERKKVIGDFITGKIDVLVGSKPIVEGVDGLQKVCNNIIPVSLPWTASDWQQLLGRIYRQGSKFKEVNVVIPEVVIDKWSWDKRRKSIIDNKRTLGEAVLDGSFEHVRDYNNPTMQKKLLAKALEALRNGICDRDVTRREVEVDVLDTEIKRRERIESEINEIHRIANSSRPENIRQNCYGDSNESFREYHRKRREAIQNNWVYDPLDKVAEIIRQYKTKVYENVIDIGCGENLLKSKINDGKTVIGVDVEKIDDSVIQANCSNLKSVIADESVQIAVHCLSLWGNSFDEYIKEDYRILESGMNAVLIIVEPTEKFGENNHYGTEEQFINVVESVGFRKNGSVISIDGKFKLFQFTK